jgi:glycine/D-amino acid oxidase-like deaminating enzyme
MGAGKNTDILVIGQGIAGTVLTHLLLEKGVRVLVLDQPSLSACSRVSAGMYNPVVIRRLTKSWLADALLPEMKEFYGRMEKLLGTPLLEARDIIKVFAEQAEQDFWERRRLEEVGKYMTAVSFDRDEALGEMPFGHARVAGAGHVRVRGFLDRSREYFSSRQLLTGGVFDPLRLQCSSAGVTYEGISASRVILCEGHKAAADPWFSWIRFAPAKGELLTVRIKGLRLEHTVHKGISLTPLGNDLFRVGSTFAWDQLDDTPTEKARAALLSGLTRITSRPVELVDHQAGVRPATSDRRPVLGVHPQHEQVAIFNGLGSKGVMLSPYFARHLCEHLLEGKALMEEVDVRRFWK